jgi:hypothetical protein
MTMVRYQMFIEEEQKCLLDELHRRLNLPVAELVRRAISRLVDEENRGVVYSETDEQVNSLLSLAGVCEGGPTDLADNHEQYLSGEKR